MNMDDTNKDNGQHSFWSLLRRKKPKRKFRQRVSDSVNNYTAPMRGLLNLNIFMFSELARIVRTGTLRRDRDHEQALRDNYALVQLDWGFTDDDEPRVKRGLLQEGRLFTLAAGMCVLISLYRGWHLDILSSALCFLGAITAAWIAVVRYWRLSVIETRKFIPIGEWLGLWR